MEWSMLSRYHPYQTQCVYRCQSSWILPTKINKMRCIFWYHPWVYYHLFHRIYAASVFKYIDQRLDSNKATLGQCQRKGIGEKQLINKKWLLKCYAAQEGNSIQWFSIPKNLCLNTLTHRTRIFKRFCNIQRVHLASPIWRYFSFSISNTNQKRILSSSQTEYFGLCKVKISALNLKNRM